MVGAATLEGNERGRTLGRPRTCGTGVKVFTGGEGNITREAGFMGNVIYHMEGNKSTDIGEANWALMRAKTRYSKKCEFKSKV